MRIYKKEVISKLNVNLFNRGYKIVVLDNQKQNTYDVHIITAHFDKHELNTLFLQEPKDSVSVAKFDKVYLMMTVTGFALWNELYGYKGKSYTFKIQIDDEYNLDTIFN